MEELMGDFVGDMPSSYWRLLLQRERTANPPKLDHIP